MTRLRIVSNRDELPPETVERPIPCMQCKHYWRTPGMAGAMSLCRDWCQHPELVKHDPVAGICFTPCSQEREGHIGFGAYDKSKARCGMSGKYFMQKRGLFHRLLTKMGLR